MMPPSGPNERSRSPVLDPSTNQHPAGCQVVLPRPMAARLVASSLPSRPVRTNPSVRGFDPARPFQSIGRFEKVDWKPLERGVLLRPCWGEGLEQGDADTTSEVEDPRHTRARACGALQRTLQPPSDPTEDEARDGMAPPTTRNAPRSSGTCQRLGLA